jgi:predicted PurR-regulated permease PerM
MSGQPLNRLQRATFRVWLAVGILVLVGVALRLLYRPIAVVLAPILIAIILVYLFNPIVTALERRGLPRLIGTAVTYLVIGAIVGGAGTLLLPLLGAQIANFAADAPELGRTLKVQVSDFLGAFGFQVDLAQVFNLDTVGERFSEFVTDDGNAGAVAVVLAALSGLARGAFALVFGLTVGPVIAFYVLVDLRNFSEKALRLVPPQHRTEVEHVGGELGKVVGGFVRGQLLIALFVGGATSLALGVVGLRFWLIIGVISGFANLVPLLGPFVAGVLGVTVALVTDGLGLALLVMVLMTGVQQLESSVLSPLIMGRTVRIHPLAVLFGVLIAAALWGILGMLLVVPAVAAAKVLASHVWRTRIPWAVGDPLVETPPGPEPTHGPPTPEHLDRTSEDGELLRAGAEPAETDAEAVGTDSEPVGADAEPVGTDAGPVVEADLAETRDL